MNSGGFVSGISQPRQEIASRMVASRRTIFASMANDRSGSATARRSAARSRDRSSSVSRCSDRDRSKSRTSRSARCHSNRSSHRRRSRLGDDDSSSSSSDSQYDAGTSDSDDGGSVRRSRNDRRSRSSNRRSSTGKGPRYPGLKELHASDPLFDEALSYRFYRLKDTSQSRSSRATGKVRDLVKRMDIKKKNHHFDGEDPSG